MKLYTVYIQGWGDDEDEMYAMGTHKSKASAEAALEEMLAEWEADGNDREDVVWDIEEHELQGA